MRASALLFWGLAGFFLLEDIGYGLWTLHDQGRIEWTGTVAMGLCFIFGVLLAFYLTVSSSAPNRLPQDRADASIEDGDPEMGFFSPWSWWPFALATSCFVVFLGFAIGIWMVMIGGALVAVALVGWVYEYYRGFHAR
ncbi:cytochrome c oxidase subunit 4 [Gryllotalpicola reticulitermitis]|uniref:Cytochrome c oxidase polypeptide 4 n=1 Tax=Gryllotalpicola reticulitermitis TaxID=1184153 RepID=A0ABV8QB09_9MICO